MASLILFNYALLGRIKNHASLSFIRQSLLGNFIPSWTFPSAYKDLDPAPETHLSSTVELLCIQSDTAPFCSLSATCLRWPCIWKSPLLDTIYWEEHGVLIWGTAWRKEKERNTLNMLFHKGLIQLLTVY